MCLSVTSGMFLWRWFLRMLIGRAGERTWTSASFRRPQCRALLCSMCTPICTGDWCPWRVETFICTVCKRWALAACPPILTILTVGLCVQKHLWFYHGLPITEITILTITLLMISVLYTVSLISSTSVHLSLQMCFILTLGKSFIWNIFLSILKENKQGLFCRYFALRLALFSIPFALQASRFWDLHSLEKCLFIKHKKLDPIMLSIWVQSQCCSRPRSPKAHTGWHFIMSEAPTACSYLCSRCLLQPILVIV